MNLELHEIIARQDHILLRNQSVTSWSLLSQARDEVEAERHVERRLRQEFAHAVEKAMMVTHDDNMDEHGRTYTIEAYVLPRAKLHKMLEAAFEAGAKRRTTPIEIEYK